MSSRKLLSSLVLMAAAIFVARTACSGPNLGREVKPEEIAAWDISIAPDGSGLPPGGGTATEGGAVYNAKCAGCHGAKGTGGPADPLVGGKGTLASGAIGPLLPRCSTIFAGPCLTTLPGPSRTTKFTR